MSRDIKAFANAVLAESGRTMFGVEEITRLCLTAMATGGHVLLEGNPGLGKTELVKTLGRVLKLPFGRIQFTPDLMPADVTGTFMPDFEGASQALKFQPGPIFTALLLADEINRATPKTQSAMLEGMAERQVTVLGRRYKLPQSFMTLATQNPIDHEGTYTLPEAQADRFMFKCYMPVPNDATMRRILGKNTGQLSSALAPLPDMDEAGVRLLPKNREDAEAKLKTLRDAVQGMTPLPTLERHILNMFLASNGRFDELQGVDKQRLEPLVYLVQNLLLYGLGPRAALAMMHGAKAWSLMFLSDARQAEPAALARVTLPVLRHRFKLAFDWEERYGERFDDHAASSAERLDRLVATFCQLCAPRDHEYDRVFRESMRETMAVAGWSD